MDDGANMYPHTTVDDFLSAMEPLQLKQALPEDCGVVESSEPWLLVETAHPHRILDASPEWFDIFLFSKDELERSNLGIITGQETAVHQLHRIVAMAQEGSSAQAPIMCYGCASRGQLMCVQGSPVSPYNGRVCKLTMHVSDAVSVDEFESEQEVSVSVAAREPWTVVGASLKFLEMYGINECELVGSSLGMMNDPVFSSQGVGQLLTNARSGLSQRQRLSFKPREAPEVSCCLRVTPLSHRTRIVRLVLTIVPQDCEPPIPEVGTSGSKRAAPPPYSWGTFLAHDAGRACNASSSSSSTSMGQALLAAPPTEPFSASLSGAAASAMADEPCSPGESSEGRRQSPEESNHTESGELCVRLCSRRKQGDPATSIGKPIEITRESILTLAHNSMKVAAQKLGISCSSLKKACRTLGFAKWPQQNAPMEMIHYDGAYVRKVYSKYAEKNHGGVPSELSAQQSFVFAERGPAASGTASIPSVASVVTEEAFERKALPTRPHSSELALGNVEHGERSHTMPAGGFPGQQGPWPHRPSQ